MNDNQIKHKAAQCGVFYVFWHGKLYLLVISGLSNVNNNKVGVVHKSGVEGRARGGIR